MVLAKNLEEEFTTLVERHVDAEMDNHMRISDEDLVKLRNDHWPSTRLGPAHARRMEALLRHRPEQPWSEFLKPILDARDRKERQQLADKLTKPAPAAMNDLVRKFRVDVLGLSTDEAKKGNKKFVIDPADQKIMAGMSPSNRKRMLSFLRKEAIQGKSVEEKALQKAHSKKMMTRTFTCQLTQEMNNEMCTQALARSSEIQEEIDDNLLGSLTVIRRHQERSNTDTKMLAEKCRRIYARQMAKIEHGLYDPTASTSAEAPIKQLSKQWDKYVDERSIKNDLDARKKEKAHPAAEFVHNMLKDYQDLSQNVLKEGKERRQREREEEMAALQERMVILEAQKKKEKERRKIERAKAAREAAATQGSSPRSQKGTRSQKMRQKNSKLVLSDSEDENHPSKKKDLVDSSAERKITRKRPDGQVDTGFLGGFKGMFAKSTNSIRDKNEEIEGHARAFGSMSMQRERAKLQEEAIRQHALQQKRKKEESDKSEDWDSDEEDAYYANNMGRFMSPKSNW